MCFFEILTTHPDLWIPLFLSHTHVHTHMYTLQSKGIDLQSQEANPIDTEPPTLPGLNLIQQTEVQELCTLSSPLCVSLSYTTWSFENMLLASLQHDDETGSLDVFVSSQCRSFLTSILAIPATLLSQSHFSNNKASVAKQN